MDSLSELFFQNLTPTGAWRQRRRQVSMHSSSIESRAAYRTLEEGCHEYMPFLPQDGSEQNCYIAFVNANIA